MANLSNINNKFLVTTGGNVLIGQTGAIGSSLLQVNGVIGVGSSNQTTLNQTSTHFFMDMTSSTSYFRNTSTAGGGFIFRNSNIGDFEFDNEFAGNIKFNTSNIERMRIASDGQVNITKGSSGTVLYLDGTNAYDAETGIQLSVGRAKISGFLNTTGGTPGSSLRFYTMPDNGSVTERMRIDSSGNIMMGKTSQSGNAALTVKSTAGGNTGIILVEGDTTNDGWGMYAITANEYRITRFTNGSYSDKFIIDSSGNTTFAGNVLLSGYLSVTSNNIGTGATRWIGSDGTTSTWFYNVPTGGNHYFAVNNSNQLSINENNAFFTGNVGIGTTSPDYLLDLSKTAVSVDTYSGINLQASNYGYTIEGGLTQNVGGELIFSSNNAGTRNPRVKFAANGNVGIGTTSPSYKLDVDGTIRATGDVIAYSDKRVKENIKTIDNSLEKVNQLRGVEFNKIGEDKKSIGVIAQEIEKILPEVVREDDKGMKSVAYGNITGILIEAIKELKLEVEELKKQIK